MSALSNAKTSRGGNKPLCVGFIPNAFPEAHSSQTGVSVEYVHDDTRQWFVLRILYGRFNKACSILKANSTKYYFPLRKIIKLVNNKKQKIIVPLLPNLIFIYAKEDEVKTLIDTTNTKSILSYYYNHFEVNELGKNPPLTIGYNCMMNFIKVTSIQNENIRIVNPQSFHYKSGDKVKVIDGEFIGVEGQVARIAGQQRVVVELRGLCLVATAYIPTAFLCNITE